MTDHYHSTNHLYILFFFNDPPTTEIYTFPTRRSSDLVQRLHAEGDHQRDHPPRERRPRVRHSHRARRECRSEEHTSELQSQSNLVCRLLLEKKKKTITSYLGNK